MSDLDTVFPRLASWAEQIGAAVWIRDPDGKLCHLNARAESLLGHPRRDWEGRPCHELIASHDELGEPFCGPDCLVLRQARTGSEIRPAEISVRHLHDGRRWVRILVVPFASVAGGDPWLLHCALSTDREHRMREFLTSVAERATRNGKSRGSKSRPGSHASRSKLDGKRLATLTPREAEVLQLLAEDHSLPEIATALGLSHVTVRNHVQHVLRKLGVHSILEAVAVRLVESGDRSEPM
jgi:DNA-binding CsgD family transcriptional regulator